MKNKHGIPIVVLPRRVKSYDCINHRLNRPKKRFDTRFLAERFVAEVITPDQRPKFRVYPCGDHFHLTTKDYDGPAGV